MNKPLSEHPKLLLDPYVAWTEKEGVPVTEDFGVDLLKCPTAHWARFGVEGGIVNLKGRGDFVSIFVLDLKPGAQTSPQKHLYEEVVYVLSGHGSTTVETERRPQALVRMGAEEPVRASAQRPLPAFQRQRPRACAHSPPPTIFCMMLNLFHNEEFVFDNAYEFPERQGSQKSFSGEGDFIPVRPGRNMWETNFVPDLAAFELKEWEARGAGGSNMMFVLADGTMHAHISQMPVGTYKKATATAPTSMSSPSPARAIRCSGTTSPRRWCGSTGSTAWCSRRPTRCSTSTSTPRPIRRATSRSRSAACAIRSPLPSSTSSWAWT